MCVRSGAGHEDDCVKPIGYIYVVSYLSRRTNCSNQSARAELETELSHLSDLVTKTEQRKLAFRAKRDYKSTAEATKTLHTVRGKIHSTRRSLEPLVMSCPFCLWNGSALFVATQ